MCACVRASVRVRVRDRWAFGVSVCGLECVVVVGSPRLVRLPFNMMHQDERSSAPLSSVVRREHGPWPRDGAVVMAATSTLTPYSLQTSLAFLGLAARPDRRVHPRDCRGRPRPHHTPRGHQRSQHSQRPHTLLRAQAYAPMALAMTAAVAPTPTPMKTTAPAPARPAAHTTMRRPLRTWAGLA